MPTSIACEAGLHRQLVGGRHGSNDKHGDIREVVDGISFVAHGHLNVTVYPDVRGVARVAIRQKFLSQRDVHHTATCGSHSLGT